MCGICGIVTKKMQPSYKIMINDALKKISHRGPDDCNIYNDDNIVFGYVRLAIRGKVNERYNQPIIHDDIIAFGNGEVYLVDNKEVSNKENDLVPLVKEITKNKEKIFERFDADFAISCYDKKNKIFYLARDFFGVKPLYITWLDKDTVAYASEIKALLKLKKDDIKLNKKTILDYLIFGYQLEDSTFYRNIFTLKPGSIFTWDLNNDKKEYFYSKELNFKYTNESDNNSIFNEIENSVIARLNSDKKIGFHLSGGMDSSLIVYLSNNRMKKMKCFTAYRSKTDNDLKYANLICKKLECKQYKIKINKNNYKELIRILDTPIMSNGDFVPLKIAQEGRRKKAKVLLEGQGADELFLGYSRFKEINDKCTIEQLIELLNNADIELLIRLFKLNMNKDDINGLYAKNISDGKNNLEKAQKFYIRNFLQELLRIEDHVHMNYSIENRVPFLSLNIREWIEKNNITINKKSNKNAEYNAHKKLNSVVLERNKKENLNGNLNDELKLNRKRIKKIINHNKIFEDFDYELINKLLNKNEIKKLNKKEAFLIWHIYNLCLWYKMNNFNEKINIKQIIKERLK